MELYILDKQRTPVAVVDAYTSLIWTTRYYTYGDFELCIPADKKYLDFLKRDYFVTRDDDDSVMLIEKIQIKTDTENGDLFIVSGRSLESILTRRIFNQQFYVTHSGGLSALINVMIYECTGGNRTAEAYRKIPELQVSHTFSPQVNMSVQFTGDVLFDAISSICKPLGIGVKMRLSGSKMVLSLYEGNEVEAVFSEEFDNLINSDYTFDTMNLANQAWVAGEGQGKNRQWISVLKSTFANRPSGLDLRELYVDARDVTSNDGEIAQNEYINMLSERGDQKLYEHEITQTFEAEVEPDSTYRYKTDYNLGDVVTVINEYGVTARPRILEIIESWDDTGYKVVPTFEELEVTGEFVQYALLMDNTKAYIRDKTGAYICVKED